jgi:hypothetical protein
MRAFVSLASAALVALAFSRGARADDIDPGVRFKPLAVQGNPIAFAVGRYGADIEYLPLPHHALHLTGFYYFAFPGVDDQFTGPGGELGYRWYSGDDGAHGWFVGGSFVAGQYEYQHTPLLPTVLDPGSDTKFVALGGAVDAGFQLVAFGNLAVGAGAGLQYVHYTIEPTFEPGGSTLRDLAYGSGLRPRLLCSVGAAF